MASGWARTVLNPSTLPVTGVITCREIGFPSKTAMATFLRALHKHCKQQKSNYIKFSASKLSKSEKNKGRSYMELSQRQEGARLLKVLKSLRTGRSQQFIFAGGGSHSWLNFDRELALKVALDTRNSQSSFLPSVLPRR